MCSLNIVKYRNWPIGHGIGPKPPLASVERSANFHGWREPDPGDFTKQSMKKKGE